MHHKKIGKWLLSALLACGSIALAQAETRVNVVGLFSDKAVVSINGGAPQTLRAGQTVDGVKLTSANSEAANFLIEGKQRTLKMGQAMSVGGAPSSDANEPVRLYADTAGHFFGNMQVNGASLKYVVDTGATTVAMNSADAKFARIDYTKGIKGKASTASGLTDTYNLRVTQIKIGTITLHDVDVAVIEGGFPDVVLLGMNVLNRLDMKRDNSIMTLTKKY